ncbi:MAG: alginate export family protein [Spirochaetia bacterium]|nr:alginate export family protein [Spirochaetia bacterium]
MKKTISLMAIAAFLTGGLLFGQEAEPAAAPAPAPEVKSTGSDVKVSGFVRARGSVRQNADWDANAADTKESVENKTQVTISKDLGENSKVVVTLQDNRVWGSYPDISGVKKDETRTTNNTNEAGATGGIGFDAREAYLQVGNIFGQPLAITMGRQKLVYGNQRLLGHLDWTSEGRSFDGLKLNYDMKDVNTLDVFTMILNENEAAKDKTFTGIYDTLKVIGLVHLDVYFLNVFEKEVENKNTIGGRLTNKADKGVLDDFPLKALDFNIEYAMQNGNKGLQKLEGSLFALDAGYTIGLGGDMKLRIGFEHIIASGDNTVDTADVQEGFQQLYGTNHAHMGISDTWLAFNDVNATSVSLTFALNKELSLQYAYWTFAENYIVAGAFDTKGAEQDFVVTYKPRKGLAVQLGYALVTPSEDTVNTDPEAADQTFAYLSTMYKF